MKEVAQDTYRRNFIGPARRHSQYDARRGVSHNSREHIVEIPYHRMDHRASLTQVNVVPLIFPRRKIEA